MSFEKLFVAALLVIFAGCSSPQMPSLKIRTSSGEKITVDMSRGGVVGPENKDFKISGALLELNAKAKQALYAFGIDFKTKANVKNITVEDVSDEKAQVLVNETNPKVEKGLWRFASPPMGVESRAIAWIYEIDESFRVYLFTITFEDGRKVTQYHATYYPSFSKAMFARRLEVEEKKP
jgi:hypothetical protein